jgi:hypothetical protein
MKTTLHLQDADTFYEQLLDAHAGWSREQSELLNARLILLLANQMGDAQVLRECIAAAPRTPPGKIRRLPHPVNSGTCRVPFSFQSPPYAMTDTLQQPGLNSLSKSFEPAAIEAHWGPVGAAGQYGRAGHRGTGAADAAATVVRDPAATTQRDRHAAHGPCVQPDHHGQPDALPPHARAQHPLGAGHRPRRHRHPDRGGAPAAGPGHRPAATTWAARTSWRKVWEWKEKSGNTITTQMRRMGDSVDWSREYFTMDDKLSTVVTETFVRLYEQGLIYRGKRLVNWDPVLKSAVSDLEVESEEEDGFLWHICYPLSRWQMVGLR